MHFEFKCPVCGSYKLYPYREINFSSLHKRVDYQCMQCFKRLQYRKQVEFVQSSKSFEFVERWIRG